MLGFKIDDDPYNICSICWSISFQQYLLYSTSFCKGGFPCKASSPSAILRAISSGCEALMQFSTEVQKGMESNSFSLLFPSGVGLNLLTRQLESKERCCKTSNCKPHKITTIGLRPHQIKSSSLKLWYLPNIHQHELQAVGNTRGPKNMRSHASICSSSNFATKGASNDSAETLLEPKFQRKHQVSQQKRRSTEAGTIRCSR